MSSSQRSSRREVVNRAPPGWVSTLFSLAFLTGGAYLLQQNRSGLLSRELSSRQVVIACAVAGLLLVGTMGLIEGVRGVLVRERLQRRRREHPAEPWMWSPYWDSTGTQVGLSRRLISALVSAVVFTLILVPFHPSRNPFLLFFDGLAVLIWGLVAYQYMQGTKYGETRLRFSRFPLYLGEEAEIFLQGADRLRELLKMKWTVRCVDETGEVRNRDQTITLIPYEETHNLTPDEVVFGKGKPARVLQLSRQKDEVSEMRISFHLPNGDLATREKPPRYWELEIQADIPGIDYAAKFYLPVYSRQEFAAAAPVPPWA